MEAIKVAKKNTIDLNKKILSEKEICTKESYDKLFEKLNIIANEIVTLSKRLRDVEVYLVQLDSKEDDYIDNCTYDDDSMDSVEYKLPIIKKAK